MLPFKNINYNKKYLHFSKSLLQPLQALQFIQFLPCLDIQQCVSISIRVAQCLGEFVLNKESKGASQHLSSTSMESLSGQKGKRNSPK